MKGKIIGVAAFGSFFQETFVTVAICVRLHVSNTNGVRFRFSGPTEGIIAPKEVIISSKVSAST